MRTLIMLLALVATNMVGATESTENVGIGCYQVAQGQYRNKQVTFHIQWPEGISCDDQDKSKLLSCYRENDPVLPAVCDNSIEVDVVNISLPQEMRVIQMRDINAANATECGKYMSAIFRCVPGDVYAEAKYVVAQINNFKVPSESNASRAPAIIEIDRGLSSYEQEEDGDNESIQNPPKGVGQ